MKKTLFYFLIVIFVIGVSTGIMESMARTYFYCVNASMEGSICGTEEDAYETPGENYSKYVQFPEYERDNETGLDLPRPNFRGPGVWINPHGFRNFNPVPQEPGKDEVRVIITGGSTAFGAGVNDEQLYSHVMGKRLNNGGERNYIVINAGINGVVSQFERIYIKKKLHKFKPNYYIMFSGWNDTYDGYNGSITLPKDMNAAYSQEDVIRLQKSLKDNNVDTASPPD